MWVWCSALGCTGRDRRRRELCFYHCKALWSCQMSINCIIKADTLLIPYIVKSYRPCILLLALHVSLRCRLLRSCQMSKLCIVRTDNLLFQCLLKCCRHRCLLLSLFNPHRKTLSKCYTNSRSMSVDPLA